MSVRAAVLVLGAMIGIGFIDNFVRVIAGQAGLWQFHAMRSALALPMIGALALGLGWRLRPLSWLRVAGRSVLSGGAMLFYFGSLAFLPIGEVVAGLFTAPIFVLLISGLVFRERVSLAQVGAVALGFGGILLILRLDAGSLSVLSLMPVLAGLLYAMGNIATRRWCGQENFLTLLMGFFGFLGVLGVVGLLGLAVWPQAPLPGADGFILRGWVWPTGEVWFWTTVQAAGSLVFVAMIITAYQTAEASLVAVFENTLLVFAAIWAFLIWGERLDGTAVLGMAAIGVAGAVIAWGAGQTVRVSA